MILNLKKDDKAIIYQKIYALERPSTFIYSGAAPEDGPMYPHHHPKFNINETSMLVVAEAVGTIVLDYLK